MILLSSNSGVNSPFLLLSITDTVDCFSDDGHVLGFLVRAGLTVFNVEDGSFVDGLDVAGCLLSGTKFLLKGTSPLLRFSSRRKFPLLSLERMRTLSLSEAGRMS